MRRRRPIVRKLPSSQPDPTAPAESKVSPYMTIEEAREYLRLPSVKSVRRMVERGEIRAHHLGRRLRFTRQDLDAALRPPEEEGAA